MCRAGKFGNFGFSKESAVPHTLLKIVIYFIRKCFLAAISYKACHINDESLFFTRESSGISLQGHKTESRTVTAVTR